MLSRGGHPQLEGDSFLYILGGVFEWGTDANGGYPVVHGVPEGLDGLDWDGWVEHEFPVGCAPWGYEEDGVVHPWGLHDGRWRVFWKLHPLLDSPIDLGGCLGLWGFPSSSGSHRSLA